MYISYCYLYAQAVFLVKLCTSVIVICMPRLFCLLNYVHQLLLFVCPGCFFASRHGFYLVCYSIVHRAPFHYHPSLIIYTIKYMIFHRIFIFSYLVCISLFNN